MKDDRLYLVSILESIGKIRSYTKRGRAAFSANQMQQDAVVRNFETIGEATKQISRRLRQKHPEVPWRQVAGFRDVLIHDYLGIDMDEVWSIVQYDLPDLEAKVKAILRTLNHDKV
ncbi:MAG: DUF86 domain-containing protein [Deltaproteobacteria bacterium]|nr:DUF86 domain-containing protein [Deltaproteobacteria bacterium]